MVKVSANASNPKFNAMSSALSPSMVLIVDRATSRGDEDEDVALDRDTRNGVSPIIGKIAKEESSVR